MKRICLLAAASVVAATTASAQPAEKPHFGTWGVELSAMDKSVRPGDNFFDYVNGTWLKTAKIPADRISTGSFQDLQILSEKRMKAIVGELAAQPYDKLTTEQKKLRDLYEAFEDTKQIDSRGLKPVQKDIAYLESLKTLDDVAKAMGNVAMQTDSPFGAYIDVDQKDPDAYAFYVTQSGLGLPDRSYFLSTDKNIAKTREAYRQYLVKMMQLAGFANAAARANRVFALEKKLAVAGWPAADRRDAVRTYNPMTVSQLVKFAPGFPWRIWLAKMNLPLKSGQGERVVVVNEKSAFPKLAAIFAQTPVPVWRDYLAAHYLHTYASYLPKEFDDENFAFYGTALTGRTQQLDRPTRGVHLLDNELGFALGKLYVAKYFPPRAKAKAVQLVANLRKAYEQDIPTLTWMTKATKDKALQKLNLLTPHIGYPDKWRDYSAYTVTRDDLVGDIQRGAEFEWNRQLKRIDGPVDKGEWGMTPPTINAYYNPTLNEIVFPAAILQPPFFDPNADDAVNYGGIGAVIGHEMSHGYDDQGSRYNAKGVLQNWWTPADRKAFDARTEALGKQYDSYEPVPGIHINGKLTMGENIADLAGMTIAYKAYHISLHGKPAPVLSGYTGDQRFFLNYGQIWRSKYRPDALRVQLLSNPHSPAEYRVIGVTRNLDPWYAAFDVTPDEKYYLPPDNRVHLW